MTVLSKVEISLTMLRRVNYTAGYFNAKPFFKTVDLKYPPTKALRLPKNVEDIAGAEKARFSPQRSRDINGHLIAGDVSKVSGDAHVLCYDSSGSINLSSSMQSNVPQPCPQLDLYTHFNMPRGMWRQGEKFLAADVLTTSTFRHYSTNQNKNNDDVKQTYATLSRKDKLKTAVKEYGSVVIVFHVGISLMSLGACYLAVTSGVDFSSLLNRWGASEGAFSAGTAAPFVVAYAIHKAFAPVRISITLVSVPFIVKYLRRIGFVKPPKSSP